MSLLASLAPTLYIQVSAERLHLRNARTGESVSEPPLLALGRDGGKIVAAGAAAEAVARSNPGIEVVRPFGHPRSLVSDYTAGEQLLRHFVHKLKPRSLLAVSPRIVLHLMGEPAGGFTQVERRAFREMALSTGASEVVLWEGRPLTDQDLLSGTFPPSGRVLS